MSEPFASDPTPPAKASKAPKAPAKVAHKSGGQGLPAWIALAALAVAVIAVALAVIGWFRPSTGPGKFGDQDKQDAKGRICAVTSTVRQATSLNTNMANPVAGDPIGALAVAANARLALYGGGGFLHERLAEEPATPADVRQAVDAMADTLQELGINYLAGEPADSPKQQPLREKLTSQLGEIDNLCQQ
ncbi:MAG TPA: hypothetical protein VFQ37_11325 [Mycobacterium sp.]|nr:hypothetical protein [Mycobacterium sp.]